MKRAALIVLSLALIMIGFFIQIVVCLLTELFAASYGASVNRARIVVFFVLTLAPMIGNAFSLVATDGFKHWPDVPRSVRIIATASWVVSGIWAFIFFIFLW